MERGPGLALSRVKEPVTGQILPFPLDWASPLSAREGRRGAEHVHDRAAALDRPQTRGTSPGETLSHGGEQTKSRVEQGLLLTPQGPPS
jgi:hypothetical protein